MHKGNNLCVAWDFTNLTDTNYIQNQNNNFWIAQSIAMRGIRISDSGIVGRYLNPYAICAGTRQCFVGIVRIDVKEENLIIKPYNNLSPLLLLHSFIDKDLSISTEKGWEIYNYIAHISALGWSVLRNRRGIDQIYRSFI